MSELSCGTLSFSPITHFSINSLLTHSEDHPIAQDTSIPLALVAEAPLDRSTFFRFFISPLAALDGT